MLAFLFAASGRVRADWSGFSGYSEIAEISVDASEIRLILRMREIPFPVEDEMANSPPPWLAGRLPAIEGKKGLPLTGRFLYLRRMAGAAGGNGSVKEKGKDDGYEAAFSYPLDSPPRTLVFSPPHGKDLKVGLIALHRGIPMSDLMTLAKPAAAILDWKDPWNSRFDASEFRRRHAEPSSYLYIEPGEMRHELLLPLKDLIAQLDLGLEDQLYVEQGEREAVKRKIGAFLLGRNLLTVNGEAPAPELDRVEFVRYQKDGVQPIADPGRLEVASALIGVVIAYPVTGEVNALGLRWDLFAGENQQRRVSVVRGKEYFDAYVTSAHPVFEWSRDDLFDAPSESGKQAEQDDLPAPAPVEGAFPLATSLLLAAFVLGAGLLYPISRKGRGSRAVVFAVLTLLVFSGLIFYGRKGAVNAVAAAPARGLDPSRADRLIQALLLNAYGAFPLHGEESAYDKLAKSLDGELLDAVYLQQRRALSRQAEGLDGEGRVDRIEMVESQSLAPGSSPGAYRVSARWIAHGVVSHWGHSHERHNLYQARLELRAMSDGSWRIVGLEFLDGHRITSGAAG